MPALSRPYRPHEWAKPHQTGSHFGGLTTGGLSNTDKGDESTIGGLAKTVYQDLGRHYGIDVSWTFEPSIAEQTLRKMLRDHTARVTVIEKSRLASWRAVEKQANRIRAIRMESGERITGKIFLDCSYEGDLMAAAGVRYHFGRESRGAYGEPLAGIGIPGDRLFSASSSFRQPFLRTTRTATCYPAFPPSR